MVIEKVVAVSKEILPMLTNLVIKENAGKPKAEKLTIRVLPEEIALYQRFVDLTEFKNVSDLIRKSVRDQIKKIRIPTNSVEKRFLEVWGIHRKIGKAIKNEVGEVENMIEKVVENIDVQDLDENLIIDFIQKQQVSSAIGISMLRKKLEIG